MYIFNNSLGSKTQRKVIFINFPLFAFGRFFPKCDTFSPSIRHQTQINMNDEQQNSNQPEKIRKKPFSNLYSVAFFIGELKNREELMEVIHDQEQNDLIDQKYA